MHLTLNEPVFTIDGNFGELADVVANPSTSTITHVVVQPHRRHYQARLVPIDLVTPKDDGLYLSIDDDQLRSLQRVSDVDYVRRPWDPIEPAPGWDIGVEQVLTMPAYGLYNYPPLPLDYSWPVTVEYDRIPRGECEITDTSAVATSDEHLVGHVDSFIVDGEHIEGVVVRTGLAGLRHRVAVPIGGIDRVRNDKIRLSVTRAQFRELPALRHRDLDARSDWSQRLEHSLGASLRTLRQRFKRAGR
jgi:sporulation protein YlmC with PRC-barrel domain